MYIFCSWLYNAGVASTLHGGATSTIVDIVGTMALLATDPTRAGVSIEMNQTFCRAATVGDELILLGSVLKYGRAMGFTEVTIRQLPDGVREAVARESSPQGIGALMLDAPVVAIGRHTKVFPSK